MDNGSSRMSSSPRSGGDDNSGVLHKKNGLSKGIRLLFLGIMTMGSAIFLNLVMFPASSSQCPFIPTPAFAPTIAPGPRGSEQWPILTVNSAKFFINNSSVLVPVAGDNLVFLGMVLDVRSGAAFYGTGSGYSLLASGTDATRALLTSSLDPADIRPEIPEDIPKGQLRDKLKQWLTFYLNKYPQIGVVEGPYFGADGVPRKLWYETVGLVAPAVQEEEPEGPYQRIEENARFQDARYRPPPEVKMDQCLVVNETHVGCLDKQLSPKIYRSRGQSRCICAIDNEIFAHHSDEFIIVHFAQCSDDDQVGGQSNEGVTCEVLPMEL